MKLSSIASVQFGIYFTVVSFSLATVSTTRCTKLLDQYTFGGLFMV